MGRNTVAKLLTNALTAAGVDCRLEKYSGTSARKVQFDGGTDAGISGCLMGTNLKSPKTPTYKISLSLIKLQN